RDTTMTDPRIDLLVYANEDGVERDYDHARLTLDYERVIRLLGNIDTARRLHDDGLDALKSLQVACDFTLVADSTHEDCYPWLGDEAGTALDDGGALLVGPDVVPFGADQEMNDVSASIYVTPAGECFL